MFWALARVSQLTKISLTYFDCREILEDIAEYERQMNKESIKSSLTQRVKLQPLQGGGGREKLLQQVSDYYHTQSRDKSLLTGDRESKTREPQATRSCQDA